MARSGSSNGEEVGPRKREMNTPSAREKQSMLSHRVRLKPYPMTGCVIGVHHGLFVRVGSEQRPLPAFDLVMAIIPFFPI